MAIDEVLDLDAVGQATAVRENHVRAEELVAAAKDRITQRNPQVDAVIHAGPPVPPVPADDGSAGPFHGVPLLVKDLWCDIAGQPSWAGMQLLADRHHRATHDHMSALRLRRAGFVIVGRTNTSELGLAVATEPRPFPPTRNPWDRERSPGGSSGGSAAAVAAGMVAAAHGNDMAGSLRIPAAWCSLVGLKPTRGHTPPPPQLGKAGRLLMQEHIVTRTVRDTGEILRAVSQPARSGHPPGHRRWAHMDDPGLLRIGVATSIGHGAAIEPVVQDAVDHVVSALDHAGHQVEHSHPEALDDPDLRSFQMTLAALHADAELRRVASMLRAPVLESDVEPPTWWLAQEARSLSESDLRQVHHDALAWAQRCRAWWRSHPAAAASTPSHRAGHDLLVTPTVGHAAPLIGAVDEWEATRFTFPFNLTGQPALSFPVFSGALPVGIQLVAAPWQEDVLLHTAAYLERQFGRTRTAATTGRARRS